MAKVDADDTVSLIRRLAVTQCSVCIHQMNRVNSTVAPLWRQHQCTINTILGILYKSCHIQIVPPSWQTQCLRVCVLSYNAPPATTSSVLRLSAVVLKYNEITEWWFNTGHAAVIPFTNALSSILDRVGPYPNLDHRQWRFHAGARGGGHRPQNGPNRG